MILVITSVGAVWCLYSEVIDLHGLGTLHLQRASNVEPDALGQWWADLAPVQGPRLGPYLRRSAALVAEQVWLEQHRLLGPDH